MIDLRNTREEAISIAELKSNQDSNAEDSNNAGEDTDKENLSKSQNKLEIPVSKSQSKLELPAKGSLSSEKSMDQDDDDDKEPKYRLDPK